MIGILESALIGQNITKPFSSHFTLLYNVTSQKVTVPTITWDFILLPIICSNKATLSNYKAIIVLQNAPKERKHAVHNQSEVTY